MGAMLVDDPAWAEIRRLYAESDEPVRVLAARFGVSQGAIFARRAVEGWPRRRERSRGDGAEGGAKRRKMSASRAEFRHQTLIRRLYTAIDLRLRHMEKRMREGETLPATEEEREARGVSSLVRSLEKALQIDPTPEKPRAGGGANGKFGADTERRRHEIAERLERFATRRQAETGPG
jgi:hypothetical protein